MPRPNATSWLPFPSTQIATLLLIFLTARILVSRHSSNRMIGQFEVKINKKTLLNNPKITEGVMPQKSRNPVCRFNLTFGSCVVNKNVFLVFCPPKWQQFIEISECSRCSSANASKIKRVRDRFIMCLSLFCRYQIITYIVAFRAKKAQTEGCYCIRPPAPERLFFGCYIRPSRGSWRSRRSRPR